VNDLLTPIWDRVDAREPRFSADDVAAWPDGVVTRLAKGGVMHEVENATSVVCDACADRHVEEVISHHGPRGFSAARLHPCPENGRVKVPLGRLRQWEIDFGGLAGAVAKR